MLFDGDSEGPRKHLTAREFVLEGIRDAMLSGNLTAGQELDDQALAEAFGVSRTPVREALKVLEVQGFVFHRPFSKPIVAPVSANHVEEVYLMRIALEGAAVAHGCLNLDDEGLAEIERYGRLGRDALARQDMGDWSRWNREFHIGLSAASGMPLLSRTIGSLIELSSFYSRLFWADIPAVLHEAQDEHMQVVQACRDRNPELASRLIQEHIRASFVAQSKLAFDREKHSSNE